VNDSIFIAWDVGTVLACEVLIALYSLYEALELPADKRVEPNKKTIASAVCRGIPAASQDPGE